MAGDLALFGAAGTILYLMPHHPLTWIVVAAGGWEWATTGGFLAWRVMFIRRERDAFRKSAQKIGF
ncbi:hypothetical protein EXS62_00315 [Candidatus Kaiserbacteria bacterium]|nr:hypothetical protein [Candidatus Kaiserbacteria bacterium]